jgi:hypothetical protein
MLQTLGSSCICFSRELILTKFLCHNFLSRAVWQQYFAFAAISTPKFLTWLKVYTHRARLIILYRDASYICKEKLVHLTDVIAEQSNAEQVHMDILLQQSSSLSTIESHVKSLKDDSDPLQGRFRETVGSVTEKIEHNPEMSASQFENVYSILKSLQDQVSGVSDQIKTARPNPPFSTQSFDRPGCSQHSEVPLEQSALLESIGRLCQLTQQEEKILSGETGQVIFEDLENLMVALSWDFVHRNPACNTHENVSVRRASGTGITVRELRKLKGMLSSSDSIGVNLRRRT